MPTRLSHALLRVFPAILLVIVGLFAALFRSRRDPRKGATPPVPTPASPTPAGQAVPPASRRGAAIALLALLVGTGLILAVVVGDGALRRLVSPPPSSDGEGRRQEAALLRPNVETGQGHGSDAVAPGGQGGVTTPGAPDVNSPAFDTVRVEPNGELVVAGQATPNGTVELLVDGKPTARAVADANGRFAIVPPALPAGHSEVGLRVTDGKGSVRQSRDSVVVAVSPSHDAGPLVALTSPDKPTVVLSQPGPSRAAPHSVPDAETPPQTIAGTGSPTRQGSARVAPGGGNPDTLAARDSRAGHEGNTGTGASDQATSNGDRPGPSKATQASPPGGTVVGGTEQASTRIVSVDTQEGGRLFVSGQASAGATVRLYLNDTLIAPARVGRDGSVRFTIGRGVKPGDYKVRLDEVDAASGKVLSRVEVPFSVPDVARIAGTDRSATASSETASEENGDGKARPNAPRPMASSPDTVSRRAQATAPLDEPRDSSSGRPAEPAAASAQVGRDSSRSEADPAVVFVPEVKTARIERGDSLWAISRRTYGEGDRYTAIYDANQDQIRDPDLIYPGQVFVLPSEDAVDAVRDEKRD